jgi:hypothetical protein
MPQTPLPYDARSVEEMERNLARLGPWAQERQRTWDERLGDVSRPLPLLPLVCTAGIVVVVVGVFWLIGALFY